MPEIGLGERGRQGRRWGHLERAWPALDPAVSYRADQVICPACQAPENQECPGGRVHPERMHEALAQARAGTLEPAPVPEPTTTTADLEPCENCGQKTRGRIKLACSDPAHRCVFVWPRNAKRCSGAAVKHGRCELHVRPDVRRWVDNAVR